MAGVAAGGSVFRAGVGPAHCAELQARLFSPGISGFRGAAWGRSELTVEGCIPWQCGRVESTQTLESVPPASRYWLPSPFSVWLWGSLDLPISEMGADTSGRCTCTSANPVVIQEHWDLVLSHCAPISRPGCTPVLPDPKCA